MPSPYKLKESVGRLLKRAGKLLRCACCGVAGGCVPPEGNCGCSGNTGCEAGTTHRTLIRQPTCAQSEGEVVYNVETSCCCKLGDQVPWTYEFHRTVVIGGCLVETMTGSGSGSPSGVISWTKDCKLDAFHCSDPFSQTGSSSTLTFPCGPQPDGFFPTTPCWAGPFGTCVSRTGYYYRDCNTLEMQFTGVFSTGDPPNTVFTADTWFMRLRLGDSPACPVTDAACGACCCNGICFGHITSSACAVMGGDFQGEGTQCIDIDCPVDERTGACCRYTLGVAACTVETKASCEADGGFYYGDDVQCTPNPCPNPPTGACCEGEDCVDGETYYTCVITNGGVWQGANTTCAGTTCDPTRGACCFADGFCDQETEVECVGNSGVWAGLNTDCNETTCPSGACCKPDGTCAVLRSDGCSAVSGFYQGDGTLCEDENCLGCCCLDGSALGTMSLADCAVAGGTWYGPNATCAIGPAPPVGTAIDCGSIGAIGAPIPMADVPGGSGGAL